MGGIIKIKDSIIHKINGFPNDVWGWGTEDKALQNRTEYYNNLANGNIEISDPKMRDTEANIKNQSFIIIDNE